MKEIKLRISDKDYDEIEKQLVFEGTTLKLVVDIVEAQFMEHPFKLEYVKGELICE